MRITGAVLASLALAFALVMNAGAQEKKKEAKATTLKGEIGCLKCGFSVADKCSNGIKVKEDGKRIPLDVKEGDTILFGKYSGQEIKINGEEHLIMREDEVLAIVD